MKKLTIILSLFMFGCEAEDIENIITKDFNASYTINDNNYQTDSISKTELPSTDYYTVGHEYPTLGFSFDTIYEGVLDTNDYQICMSVKYPDNGVLSVCSSNKTENYTYLEVIKQSDSTFTINFNAIINVDSIGEHPDSTFYINGTAKNFE